MADKGINPKDCKHYNNYICNLHSDKRHFEGCAVINNINWACPDFKTNK